MIYSVSEKLAKKLLETGYFEFDDHETITYGLFIILSRILYALISIVVGIICNCFIESIVFYSSFLFLRKYAGGVHAKTEGRCFIASTVSIASVMLSICLGKKISSIEICIALLALIFSLLIIIFAPVPSVEKPQNNSESKRYKKKTVCRIFILLAFMIVMQCSSNINICVSINSAITLEGILLVIGKIKVIRLKEQ